MRICSWSSDRGLIADWPSGQFWPVPIAAWKANWILIGDESGTVDNVGEGPCPAGNSGKCDVATVAILATVAYYFLQLTESKTPLRERGTTLGPDQCQRQHQISDGYSSMSASRLCFTCAMALASMF